MQKKRYFAALFLALAASVATIYLNSVVASGFRPSETATAFQSDRYLAHVRYLASDELKGRGDGTPELEQAAEYIAGQFRTLGLRPAGENGTFFQTFQVTTGAEFGPSNEIQIDNR